MSCARTLQETWFKPKLCKVPETLNSWGGRCRCAALPLFYCLLETSQSSKRNFFCFDLYFFLKYTRTRSHSPKQQKCKILPLNNMPFCGFVRTNGVNSFQVELMLLVVNCSTKSVLRMHLFISWGWTNLSPKKKNEKEKPCTINLPGEGLGKPQHVLCPCETAHEETVVCHYPLASESKGKGKSSIVVILNHDII